MFCGLISYISDHLLSKMYKYDVTNHLTHLGIQNLIYMIIIRMINDKMSNPDKLILNLISRETNSLKPHVVYKHLP